MNEKTVPHWLEWARQLQSIGQSGLAYSTNDFDCERYRRLFEIAAAIVHSHTGLPSATLMENFAVQPGYATPKVGVRGAVIRDGEILLVRERDDGCWCMPGGWADVGERPSEAAAREVLEESGLIVIPRKLVGIYDANRVGEPLSFYHAYKVVFLCDIAGGELRSSDETPEVGFFNPDELPQLSHERTGERHIVEAFAHYNDAHRPAAFD